MTRRARRRRRRSACASPPSGENDFRRHVVWNTHTMDSISRDSTTQKRPKTERETPLGLPRGVFLCRLCAANTSRRLSSGVFRLCFGFSAVVIRLSCKCRLKSTLSGFSTFTAERLSVDSPTLSDSRLATSPPTLRLPATTSDSPTPSDSPTIRDFRLSTCWVLGTLTPCAAIPRVVEERRAAVEIARAGAAMIARIVEERRAAWCGKSTPKRRAIYRCYR